MPTTTPTVSVIIPCFNSRRYVRRTLQSAFAQTESPLEVICVDDGSEDGTVDLLNEISDHSPLPIRVLGLSRNSGACAARNAGLELALGDYVQFLDSDDLLKPDKLAHQLALISRLSTRIDLVAADCIFHYPKGPQRHWRWPRSTEVRFRVDRRHPLHGLVISRLGRTSSNLWRADALRQVNGFNPQFRTSNEYELMFRLLQCGAKVIADSVPNTVLFRRRESLSRPGSTSERTAVAMCSIDLRLDILRYMERQRIATATLRHLVYGKILSEIRAIATHDSRAATNLYANLLPPGFIPLSDTAGLGYRLLLRTFGFARAERLARFLGRAR